MPLTEADTCRKFVVPKLQAAGWDSEPHSIAEQRTITDGRIVPVGQGFVCKPPRRVDYLLRFERNFPLAVVEAKAAWKSAVAFQVCWKLWNARWNRAGEHRRPGILYLADRYGPEARAVLKELLEKYAEHGDAQLVLPDVLKVPALSAHGQIGDIIALFGGPDQQRSAVSELQNLLYAA